jgi:putative phosphoribosyl transferase
VSDEEVEVIAGLRSCPGAGRPDLAERRLQDVIAPTLLIVGGHDDVVLALNRQAQAVLGTPDSRLAVVPSATHLFEEPDALPAVADFARRWFVGHLAPQPYHAS